MADFTHHFKNTWTSFSHVNFRLDIFHCKTLFYFFEEGKMEESGIKADRTCKIFSYLNICSHDHYLFVYILRKNTFIFCQVHYTLS